MKKKKTKNKPRYSVLNNIGFLARDMVKTYPILILFFLLEMILAVISPVLSIYIPKLTIDLVTSSASIEKILITLGGAGIGLTLAISLSNMAGQGKYLMYNAMRTYYTNELFMQSLDCDYFQIESPEGQTKYNRARDTLRTGDWSGTSKLTVATLDIFVATASFLIYSGIISTLNIFVIGFLVLLSCVNLFAVKYAQKYEYSQKDNEAQISKQMGYVEHTANDWKWGKDIRLYSMSGWLLEAREILLNVYTALNNKIKQRYFMAGVVNALTLLLRDGVAYGYLIWAVSSGSITIGNFVLYFGAITGFSGFVSQIIGDVNELNGASLQMNDMRDFLDNTDAPAPENPASIPSNKLLSIEFNHVYFSYSKDSEPVLSDFNMTIHAGEKVALVGVNGAGKTTIVKLLCGFYSPDSGKILIDGININRFCKKDLYKAFSAIFQDVFITPFTVAENISMKTMNETDLKRVDNCLKKSGLYDTIEKYPKKTKEFMLKEVNDGIVLSGGQQQKLLMARALYKDAPILILDEPTAALDPIAESETYESFHKVASDKTALYISHRLASTRFCDKVIFIHNGTDCEVGTHDELLRYGGEYAKMYEMQSHYYKIGGGDKNA